MTTEDPCVTCRCNMGRLTCAKKACPVLHCPVSRIVQGAGECCPRCKGKHTITLSTTPIPTKRTQLTIQKTITHYRKRQVHATATRRLHAGHDPAQFRLAVLPGRVHSLLVQQHGHQLRQGDLSRARVQQRVPDQASRPMLSPVSAGRGEPGLLHLRRQNLRGEYHCRAHCAPALHRRGLTDLSHCLFVAACMIHACLLFLRLWMRWDLFRQY